jgi:hypothetical protein
MSIKDDEGKIVDHMIGLQDTEMEAYAFISGWAQAIIAHTDEDEYGKIRGLFRVEMVNKKGETDEKS